MNYSKIIIIIFGSIFVTTLGIAASDSWQGNSGSLLGQLIGAKQPQCQSGMIFVPTASTFSCVDTYEASPSSDCANSSPNSSLQTTDNLNNNKCKADSKVALPWVFINRSEATLACSRAGKRLPSASEWYHFSLGTKADSCNVNSRAVTTPDKFPACLSDVGVVGAIGNVWEWTTGDVIDSVYNGRKLPGSGYVAEVDNGGMATSLRENKNTSQFLNGYLWSNTEGNSGVLRGGYYSSREDAGLYTVQAQTPTSFSGAAIGFRCVR